MLKKGFDALMAVLANPITQVIILLADYAIVAMLVITSTGQ